jgi:hypothetical protein
MTWVLMLIATMPCYVGCIGLVANLIHAGWGDKIPARFEGLAQKRVAVACVSRSSLFGPSSAAKDVVQRVESRLEQNVPEISMIRQSVVEDWIDQNGWDEVDFRRIGAGIDAQMMVGIDIIGFSLHEGSTIFKGRCDVEVTVYDMDAGGKIVFNEVMPQIQYPAIAVRHVNETTEADFRRQFVEVVAEHIARNFYPHDRIDDFGRDSALVAE